MDSIGIITAEQAAEAAKGLTFEIVWAALMENRQQIQETNNQIQKTDNKIQETSNQIQETQNQMREMRRETKRTLDELSKNIGGLGNSIGRMTEILFSANLWKKFNELGYPFSKQGPNVKFIEDKKVLAEADFLLENGEYAMVVEVKTEPSTENIREHLARMEKIRRYFDARGDRRRLVGAVAGGLVNENVLEYAQKQGLYVIIQTGDSATVAEFPPGFKAREW